MPSSFHNSAFTENGITYGEEVIGMPREQWTPLDPEEVKRRRARYQPEPAPPQTLLTGGEKKITPWTRQQWAEWPGTRATMAARKKKGATLLGEV